MSDESAADWWSTEVIQMAPGEIRYRGYAIEELIGNVSFTSMIWLMLRSELPTQAQADLLEIALMAGVDHGPQAPSIAIARMAATCGVGLNSAMASAVNVLGDVHGGAGEQALELYNDVLRRVDVGASVADAAREVIASFQSEGGTYLPGFGHRFHPVDPRAPRLVEVSIEAIQAGTISGDHIAAAREIEKQLGVMKGRSIPLNIDGATAAIYGELGFPPPLARGLFCLSRSVGILAHAWEQMQQGGRNKGPIPRNVIWSYTGPEPRPVPKDQA